MRAVIAGLLGGLVGVLAPGPLRRALAGLISSANDTLSWQAGWLAQWATGPGSLLVAVCGALAAALALPALLFAVAQSLRAGRSARSSAGVVLAACALAGLLAPAVNSLPFLCAALLLAAAVVLLPLRWAVIPVAFFVTAAASTWAVGVLSGEGWVMEPAVALGGAVGGPPVLWGAALGAGGAVALWRAVTFAVSAR